jgi:serine/threonine-protein kinase
VDAEPAGRALEPGAEVAGYTVDALLGRGGMGAVYTATHRRLKRRVALKVVVPELAADAGFRERFIRESEIAASLDHPNVVPIYDADEQDGLLFIAMRYVEGSDLGALLHEGGPLTVGRCADVLAQVGGALDAAHAAGLVHRDVKPANILLDRSGYAYLSDFGIAKRAEGSGLTHTGSFVGSVDYAAPEQIEGKHVDGRADVYSLGCVAYHCLAGAPPFVRDSEVRVIMAHLQEPPPPLPGADGPLAAADAAIRTALAKDRDERYRHATELAGALAVAGRDAPASALFVAQPPTGPPAGSPTVDAPAPAGPPPADPLGAAVRTIARNDALRLGALLGAVAVALPALLVFLLSVPSVASLQLLLGTRFQPSETPSVGARLARSIFAPWIVQWTGTGTETVEHGRWLAVPSTALVVLVLLLGGRFVRRRLPRHGNSRLIAVGASAASSALLLGIAAAALRYHVGSDTRYTESAGTYAGVAIVVSLLVLLFALGIVGSAGEPLRRSIATATLLVVGLALAAAVVFPVAVVAGGARHSFGHARPLRDLAVASRWAGGSGAAATPLAFGAAAALQTQPGLTPFTRYLYVNGRNPSWPYSYRPRLAAYTATHRNARVVSYAGKGGALWALLAIVGSLAVVALWLGATVRLVRALGAPRAVDGLQHGLLLGGSGAVLMGIVSWLATVRLSFAGEGGFESAHWGVLSGAVVQTAVELVAACGLAGLVVAALRPAPLAYTPRRLPKLPAPGSAPPRPAPPTSRAPAPTPRAEFCTECGTRFENTTDAYCLGCGAAREARA